MAIGLNSFRRSDRSLNFLSERHITRVPYHHRRGPSLSRLCPYLAYERLNGVNIRETRLAQ